jgi:hypothetical protein
MSLLDRILHRSAAAPRPMVSQAPTINADQARINRELMEAEMAKSRGDRGSGGTAE